MIEILTDNHHDSIMGLFSDSGDSIKIISPFLSRKMAEQLCITVQERGIDCEFITRFYLQDMIDRANDIDGLEMMIKAGIKVYAVKGLHTKLYLFDHNYAVLGSANFTTSGFKTNIELSLLFSGEPEVTDELHSYFDDLRVRAQTGGGEVTESMIADARDRLHHLWKASAQPGKTTSGKMYGPSIDLKNYDSSDAIEKELTRCKDDTDAIYDMFHEHEVLEEIKIDHTIWLKFDGEGDDRIDPKERFPMIDVWLDGQRVWVENYPWRPNKVADGDEVYLAAITMDCHTGKNQPVIMGRGRLRAFSGDNRVRDEWVNIYSWMKRYPYFVVVDECEVLDAGSGEGIPLDLVLSRLGSDTYVSSFGRGEDIKAVAKKHHQKPHLRLSGNAKRFIDDEFDKLAKKYGTITYTSDRG